MKKYFSLLILSLLATMIVSTQMGCATRPANTGNSNMATPQATPDKNAISAEITKMEMDWSRIIKEHDAATVRRIEADDAVFVYPDGSTGGKDADVKDMESGALSADSWEVTEVKVNVLDNDSAVATGRSIAKGAKYKLPDGKTKDISGQYRWVDTYARRNGQWVQVAGASAQLSKDVIDAEAKVSSSPAASVVTKSSPAAKMSPAAKSSPTKMPPPPPKQTP